MFGYCQCSDNKELQERVNLLERRFSCLTGDNSSGFSEQGTSEEYVDELRKKVQLQVITYFFDFSSS